MTYLSAFRKAFKIDKAADLRNVAIAIEAISTANGIALSRLGDIDPPNGSAGFRIHSLLNLIGRTFEHAQAMLVAAATGSPASAEALGRIVVEGSVNIMFLALKGDAGTLVRFYRTWLTEHDRKLTEWKQKAQTGASGTNIPAMIEERRRVIAGLEVYLRKVEAQCGIDASAPSSEWPKSLFQRFQAIGRETDYYESYHRLSGSSHLTGEDTLTWLIALEMPDDMRRKLGEEAWAYSIMMTRLASIFFIDAAACCCQAFGVAPDTEIGSHRASLARAVIEIAGKAGVPLEAGRR